MKKFKKIMNIAIYFIINFFTIIITLFVILAICYGVQVKFLNKQYADIFGYTIFNVATGSMSGTIEVGDIILVKITNDVSIGDVVVYSDGTDLITHRIIKMDENDIVTKGDANNTEDKAITKECIIGRVQHTYHNLAILIKVISQPQVLVGIIASVILLGVCFSYNKLGNKKEDIDAK